MALFRLLWFLAAGLTASATTLQRLSLDEMVQQSTSIVRGVVSEGRCVQSSSGVFTVYKVDIRETLKGSAVRSTEVASPGGVLNGLRYVISGAPVLEAGQEYVLFLWRSKSGVNRIIGLTQGVFTLSQQDGKSVAAKMTTTESMVDRLGRPVADFRTVMTLDGLRIRIRELAEEAKR